MAEKLDVNWGKGDVAKKQWEAHQANEYLHVDNYKEAVCWGCMKKTVCSALLLDCCGPCVEKRGEEAILTTAGWKIYGLCFLHGQYCNHIYQVNARFCLTCHGRVKKLLQKYNKAGGPMGFDPFWKKMRKQLGKDYKLLMKKPEAFGLK